MARTFEIPRLAAHRYSIFGSESFTLIDLQRTSRATLVRQLGLKAATAELILKPRKRCPLASATQLVAQRASVARELHRIHGRAFYAGEAPLHIVDVVPGDRRVMSTQPFALDVQFQNSGDTPVALVSVTVLWAGDPFVVEQEVSDEERERAVS